MSLPHRLVLATGVVLLLATPGVAAARVTVGPGVVAHADTSDSPAPTASPTTPSGPTTTSTPRPGAAEGPAPTPPDDTAPTTAAGTPTDSAWDDRSDVPADVRASVPPAVAGTIGADARAVGAEPEMRCDGPATEVELDPAEDWRRVVVDPIRRLPRGWAPNDLVEVEDVAFEGDAAPRVRALLVHDLRAMHAAASAAGARFLVVSGFRSEAHQQRLWDAEVDELGTPRRAAAGLARPGRSEHQLGTTIDVVDPSLPRLTPELVDTPAGRWLARHAADYGFVVSYPAGGHVTTCFKPEPWHLRYVGAALAGRFVASGDTLREFLLDESTVAPPIG